MGLSQIDREGVDQRTRELLEGGLDDCYTSADEALGRVLDAAPPNARVIVFALHGMGPNDGSARVPASDSRADSPGW